MKDNETLYEFKERICRGLSEIGLEYMPSQLSWLEDCGMDG